MCSNFVNEVGAPDNRDCCSHGTCCNAHAYNALRWENTGCTRCRFSLVPLYYPFSLRLLRVNRFPYHRNRGRDMAIDLLFNFWSWEEVKKNHNSAEGTNGSNRPSFAPFGVVLDYFGMPHMTVQSNSVARKASKVTKVGTQMHNMGQRKSFLLKE